MILIVALLFFVATIAAWRCLRPRHRASTRRAPTKALRRRRRRRAAVESTIAELREGLGFIQSHRNIFWPLTVPGITASLIGVLGVLGPGFAKETLGLTASDFVVVVLPMGLAS